LTLDAQQRRGPEIRPQDDRVLPQRQIAHRREIVKVAQLIARFLELALRAAQFFVLQLQFDLVDLQLVH